jgi:aminomethyltransferase
MRRTALYQKHVDLGGRIVDFAGWALPVQYPTGPTQEHLSVRTAAGLFDIDHMGQFELSGPDADDWLRRIQTADLSDVDDWGATYSLITYADGTIVDDVFLYRLPNRWLIVVNAANREKDMAWLQAHTAGFDIQLSDISDSTYMLALQGPASEAILQKVTDADLSELRARTAVEADVSGVATLIGRTGYTGEDGFELYFPADSAEIVWDALLEAGEADGLLPCGLGARDSLRFEAGLALYGHEIDQTTNPIEARLAWVVDLDHDFIGHEALLKASLEGPSRHLVGLEMAERGVPREGYSIAYEGEPVGYVTSGMRSPTLERFLAMGYVDTAHSAIGSEVDIIIRGEPRRASIVKRPFYRRQKKT